MRQEPKFFIDGACARCSPPAAAPAAGASIRSPCRLSVAVHEPLLFYYAGAAAARVAVVIIAPNGGMRVHTSNFDTFRSASNIERVRELAGLKPLAECSHGSGKKGLRVAQPQSSSSTAAWGDDDDDVADEPRAAATNNNDGDDDDEE